MVRSHDMGSLAPARRAHSTHALALALLAALGSQASSAQAQDGLRAASVNASGNPAARTDASPLTSPHWQARFGVASPFLSDPAARLQGTSLHLLGDYYWQGFRPARFGVSGGFRATSGLLVGERTLSLMLASTLSRSHAPSSVGVQALRLGEAERELALAVPYVGVGYSGVSLRGGWGFTADLGLAGTGGGLQMRRDVPAHTRGADDILRELRLTPVLQIGASYAF
ncbi:MAG: hypothetical protein ABIQ29_06565 [Burkholderiaceae bacterium]